MLLGHVSRILAVPVMVVVSPCLRDVCENWTSHQDTASIRTNPSWARSPWAEAVLAPRPATASAAAAAPRTPMSLLLISSPLHLLQEASDRPDRQVSADELTDPVAHDRQRRAERKRDVLRLLEERAQRAALDDAQ